LLIVRLPAAMSAVPSGMGKDTQMTEATDFYDFGVPVHLSAPPAAQVASMGQVISGGGSVISGKGSVSPPSITPPPASGTLAPAQAAVAEQAVTAFFAALGRNDAAAVARTVVPSQPLLTRPARGGGCQDQRQQEQ
jgi:hypothetical protein